MGDDNKYIVIGGSAGSFQSIILILESLPKDYKHTVILVLHRLKHIRNGFVEALNIKSKIKISEPEDKEKIKGNHVYLVPANYHLYVEEQNTFALSIEETVNHSRPSIDITFASAAYTLKTKLTGIILSGANGDGANGLKRIEECEGKVIIQDLEESQVRTMPERALNTTKTASVMTISEIIKYITQL